MSQIENISYTDTLIDLAESLNELAPLVDAALHVTSPNLAAGSLYKIINHFEKLIPKFIMLTHIKKLMEQEGFVMTEQK